MVATSTAERTWCLERDERESFVPRGQAVALVCLLAVVLVLAITPAAIAAWSIARGGV